MGLPPGQKHTRMVRRALSAIAAGEGECGRGGGYEGSGGVPKLTMQEALIASRALRTGCGQYQATFKVNAWRQAKGKQPVTPRRRPCSRTTRTTSARSSCGGTCARSWTRSRVSGATQHVLGLRGRHELGLRGRNGSWGRLAFLSRRFTGPIPLLVCAVPRPWWVSPAAVHAAGLRPNPPAREGGRGESRIHPHRRYNHIGETKDCHNQRGSRREQPAEEATASGGAGAGGVDVVVHGFAMH